MQAGGRPRGSQAGPVRRQRSDGRNRARPGGCGVPQAPIGASSLLVANKVDGPGQDDTIHELHALGLGELFPVSAEHARGIDELMAAIDAADPAGERRSRDGRRPRDQGRARGPPERREILAAQPSGRGGADDGLRRPGHDTRRGGHEPDVGLRRYLLVDTAGMRRKGRLHEPAESLSVMRARQAIERADVVVLVLDGSEPIAAQDAHIAGYAGRSVAAHRRRGQQVGPRRVA